MAFRRWFPRSLVEQAAFYANFTRVFVEIAPPLGFTAEDIAKLETDNAVMQYLAHTEAGIEAFKKSFKELKKNLTTGQSGKTPIYLNYVPFDPPPIVPYGMFERLFKLVDKIVAADNYTAVIGAQLRILPKSGEAVRIADLQLELEGTPLTGAQAVIRFVRRKANGVNLFMRRDGHDGLIDLGRFFSSPAIVKIPLLDASKPEKIYICGRYLDGNEAVGNLSPLVELLIAP